MKLKVALVAGTLAFFSAIVVSGRSAEATLRAANDEAANARCTCMSPKRPPCELWWQTSAIFVGRVTRVRTVTEEDSEGNSRVKNLVSMRVQERWRGLQTERDVEIATGAGGGDCGFRFEENTNYLVYANQSVETGRYETGICSRTAKLDDAVADLAYLRGVETADPVVSLYGMVYRERQSVPPHGFEGTLDPGGPMSGVQITLSATDLEPVTVSSDTEGWYEFDSLGTGRYQLSLAGEGISGNDRWRLAIPTAPACIWRNIIVDPKPFTDTSGSQ